MSNVLTTINQLEMAGAGLVVVGGLGMGVYLYFKWLNKKPEEILDDLAGGAEKIIGDPLAGAIKTTTGGALNFKTRTLGTLGSAQDLYESDLKMKKTPGLKFLATIGVASPQLALVTGVGQLIKQGKDKKLAQDLSAKGDPENLTDLLTRTQEAVTSKDAEKVEDIKLRTKNDVRRLIKPEQLEEITRQVNVFVDNHKFMKPASWTESRKNDLKKVLVFQKQVKYLINRGVFMKEEWRKASFLNQRMITRAMSKILTPQAVILIDKKNVDIVKDFIKSF